MKDQLTSFQDIRDFIILIEQKFPVDSWQYHGIYVWPFIRVRLYYQCCLIISKKQQVTSKIPSFNSVNKGAKNNRLKKLKSIYALLAFYLKIKTKKIVFFSINMHRTILNNRSFNRFFDSMIEEHALENDVISFELRLIKRPAFNDKNVYDITQFYNTYLSLQNLKKRFKVNKNTSEIYELEQLDFFRNYIFNYLDPSNLSWLTSVKLEQWAQKIVLGSQLFTRFYKKMKPKKIIALSYYGYDVISSAFHAANKLGIVTVDLQHGPEADVHMCYAHWTKIPKEGFSIMPTEYWNWDQESVDSIQDWGKKANIQARLVGQPWLDYCIKKYNYNDELEGKRFVLYSLQRFPPYEIEDMFTDQIIEAMKSLDFTWILRLHPRNNINQSLLENYLKSNRIDDKKYQIEKANDVPLAQSILKSVVHLTNFSGTLIEASLLKLTTVIIDDFGKDVYSNYMDNKLVFYINKYEADFSEKISQLISSLPHHKIVEENTIYNPLA